MTDLAIQVVTVADGVARISWDPRLTAADWRLAIDAVRRDVEKALVEHPRVEAHVAADDQDALRLATWAGMRREGVMRGVESDLVVFARLRTDTPVHEPGGFRALLNSFLPRKRAISQMLVRDHDDRVLLCHLTYKQDWDLPGGVVEVGESPQLAVSREVSEELGLTIPAGRLLLTDWLPPWGGWDDALCLVFDGGVHDPEITDTIVREAREIRDAEFCTVDQARERCADFTARRVEAAIAATSDDAGPAYTESGPVAILRRVDLSGVASARRSRARPVEPTTAAGITRIAPSGTRKNSCVAMPKPSRPPRLRRSSSLRAGPVEPARPRAGAPPAPRRAAGPTPPADRCTQDAGRRRAGSRSDAPPPHSHAEHREREAVADRPKRADLTGRAPDRRASASVARQIRS